MAPLPADERAAQADAKAAAERWHVLASRMQDLMGYLAWDVYREQMEQLEARVTERMITGGKEDFDYCKGRIEGLREAYNLPQLIIDKAKGLTNG
jgi:hypothetical protein